MKIYSKIIAMGIISTVILTGCTSQEDTKISTIDDNSNEVVVVNINDTEEIEKQNSIKNYFLSSKTKSYTFVSKSLTSETYQIDYPQIIKYDGELTADYINQSIESYAKNLISNTSDVLDGNKLTYSYEISSENDNFISIKFTGIMPYEGSSYTMIHALNIDLNSTNAITFENIFTKDTSILDSEFKKASVLANASATSPKNYMIMHIENNNIVFSYLENDTSTEFTEVSIPIESIIDNLNIDFGEIPAS